MDPLLIKLQTDFVENVYSAPDEKEERPKPRAVAECQRGTEDFIRLVDEQGVHLSVLPRDFILGPWLALTQQHTKNTIVQDMRAKSVRRFVEWLRTKDIAVPVLDWPVISRPVRDPNKPRKRPAADFPPPSKPTPSSVPAEYIAAGEAAVREAVLRDEVPPTPSALSGPLRLVPAPAVALPSVPLDLESPMSDENLEAVAGGPTGPADGPVAPGMEPVVPRSVGRSAPPPRNALSSNAIYRIWVESAAGVVPLVGSFSAETVNAYGQFETFISEQIIQSGAFPLPNKPELHFQASMTDAKMREGQRSRYSFINPNYKAPNAPVAAAPPVLPRPVAAPGVSTSPATGMAEVLVQLETASRVAEAERKRIADQLEHLRGPAASDPEVAKAVAALQGQVGQLTQALDNVSERLDEIRNAPVAPVAPPIDPMALVDKVMASAERFATKSTPPPPTPVGAALVQSPAAAMREAISLAKEARESFAPAEAIVDLSGIEERLDAMETRNAEGGRPKDGIDQLTELFEKSEKLKKLLGVESANNRPKSIAEVIGEVLGSVITNAPAIGDAVERSVSAIVRAKQGIATPLPPRSPATANGGPKVPQAVIDAIGNLIEVAAGAEVGPKGDEEVLYAAFETMEEFKKDPQLAKVQQRLEQRVSTVAADEAQAVAMRNEIAIVLRKIFVAPIIGFEQQATPQISQRIATVMVKKAIVTARKKRAMAEAHPNAIPARPKPHVRAPLVTPPPVAPGAPAGAPPPPEEPEAEVPPESDPEEPESEETQEPESEEEGSEPDAEGAVAPGADDEGDALDPLADLAGS